MRSCVTLASDHLLEYSGVAKTTEASSPRSVRHPRDAPRVPALEPPHAPPPTSSRAATPNPD
eukprot:2770239-Prymnesium_polylepis.1